MASKFWGRRDQIERAERLAERMMRTAEKRVPRTGPGYADTERTRLYEEQIRKYRKYEIDYIENHLQMKELAALEKLLDIVTEAKGYKKPKSLATRQETEFTDRQLEIAIKSLERQERK